MSEPKKMQAVLRFRAFDTPEVPIAELPWRVRKSVETHPTLSFPIDSVSVIELHTLPGAIPRERLAEMRARITGETGTTPTEDLLDARELLAQVDRLEGWVQDLLSGCVVNCVYCGHSYGPDPGTPVAMGEVLKAHVEVCPDHPMSKLRKGAERLLVASNDGRDAIGKVIDLVQSGSPAHDLWLAQQAIFEERGAAAKALAEVLGH